MEKKFLKVAICSAWAAFAMSAATPSSARAITAQSGSYAACSNYSDTDPFFYCDVQFNYVQSIKFIGSPCNSGSCGGDWLTDVESLYSTGRKTTSYIASCGDASGNALWEIGSCGC